MTGKKIAEQQLLLPDSVVGRVQLARMVRELEALDNEFEAQKARHRGAGSEAVGVMEIPAMSQSLADCVELNKIDILHGQARMRLKRELNLMREKSPTIHFTFATQADPLSLQQLVAYVRKEIHPQALVSVGLQPALVGGAYVRTPNRAHDFSLKARLQGKRGVIAQDLAQQIGQAQPGQSGELPVRVVEQPVRQEPKTPNGWPERRPADKIAAQTATRPAVQSAVQPMARQAAQAAPAQPATRQVVPAVARRPHAK